MNQIKYIKGGFAELGWYKIALSNCPPSAKQWCLNRVSSGRFAFYVVAYYAYGVAWFEQPTDAVICKLLFGKQTR